MAAIQRALNRNGITKYCREYPDIVRSEIRLAKAEIRNEAGKAGEASKSLAVVRSA